MSARCDSLEHKGSACCGLSHGLVGSTVPCTQQNMQHPVYLIAGRHIAGIACGGRHHSVAGAALPAATTGARGSPAWQVQADDGKLLI